MLKKLWTTDYNIILASNYLGKPSSPLPVSYLCTFGVFRRGVASGGALVVPYLKIRWASANWQIVPLPLLQKADYAIGSSF